MLGLVIGVNAGEIAVITDVEKNQVMLGEPFVWQITVNGTTQANLPPLDELRETIADFNVAFLGERPQTMSSVTIINGQRTATENSSVVLQYQLIAQKIGALNIPAIELIAGGKKLSTTPLIVRVVKAVSTPNFHVEFILPRPTIYVGETINIPVALYFIGNVNSVNFTLPLAQLPPFTVQLPFQSAGAENEIHFPVNGQNIIARHGEKKWQGKNYHSVFFNVLLRAKTAGTYELPPITVNGAAGGDGFFRNSQRFYAVSDTQKITVLNLPSENRPADFSGLIGEYKIAATIEPHTAAIGDPLTLTIVVTGNGYLSDIELPPLNQLPELTTRFKIPAERADGKITNGAKIFTQTLRALNSDVKNVPPITLPFFNPSTAKYERAVTNELSLNIQATKIVGLADAEGYTVGAKMLADEKIGLAPNYIGTDCLTSSLPPHQLFTRWQWAIIIGLPLLYFLLRGYQYNLAHNASNARAWQAQKSLPKLRAEILALQNRADGLAEVANVLRNYFSARWQISIAVLTYADLLPHLKNASTETLSTLQEIFTTADAARYAPKTAGKITTEFAQKIIATISKID